MNKTFLISLWRFLPFLKNVCVCIHLSKEMKLFLVTTEAHTYTHKGAHPNKTCTIRSLIRSLSDHKSRNLWCCCFIVLEKYMRGSLKVTSYNSNCNKFIRSDPEGDKKGFFHCAFSLELTFVKQTNVFLFSVQKD